VYYISLALLHHHPVANRFQPALAENKSVEIQWIREEFSENFLMDAAASLYHETSSIVTSFHAFPKKVDTDLSYMGSGPETGLPAKVVPAHTRAVSERRQDRKDA
jgi:fumarate hydratase class II